ncbi:glycoside hydrolase family 44 protein [Acetivibrio cellulolyticus]|uniref:glycoside hydrolase family 44 protein n=1 Tax=Acetivibrio cellulolyticus TaxID=35830 RepID=UPI000685A27F|nr:glycoside hydrolase family 44 protein [Acetivibrio cellulolyticus]
MYIRILLIFIRRRVIVNKKVLAFLLSFQLVSSSALVSVLPVSAAQASVDVSIDTEMERTSISPYIYGVNQDLTGQTITARRFGGNRTTAYNWENNASNAGSDWIHSSDNYIPEYYGIPKADSDKPGEVASVFHDQSLAQNVPYTLMTLQAAGYVSADKDGEVKEADKAPSARWKEVKFAKNAPFSLTPDVTDDYVYMDEYVNFLVDKYGSSSTATGIKGYSVDNEPALWAHTHARIHPDPVGCAELIDRTSELSKAVKNVDPTAEIFGPALYGFGAYLTLQSAPDWVGGLKDSYNWFVDYYLEQMKAKSDEEGKRLLDVFDVHYYSEARGGGSRVNFGEDITNTACNKARLQAPRTLWQESFKEDSWIGNETSFDKFRPIIPKIQESIDKYYPGTKLAITEYDFGGGNHITGGIAEADTLGIFGKYGVYLSTYWGSGDKDYIVSGMNLYTNYDGKGSKYGDTNVKCAVSNDEVASAYSSIVGTDDGKLHIILLNKNYDTSTTFNLSINSSTQYKSGTAWGFDRVSSDITEKQAITEITDNKFTYTLPALSAYHIVLDTESIIDPTIKVGDIYKDGKVNALDFAFLRRYLLGFDKTIDKAADTNADGKINSIDFSILRSYILRQINQLPYIAAAENKEPIAEFTASKLDAVTDEDISFDASTSSDPDGNISYYAWDFGDGTEGSGITTKHKYAKAGKYTAKLIVSDDMGASSTAVTKDISITSATGDNSDFGFETTTEGFAASGEKGTTGELSVTTEKAFKGNGCLKLDVNAADGGMVQIYLDGESIEAGSKVTFRVWIPSDAPLAEIQGYVMPHSPSWDVANWNAAWNSYEYMKKGAWNEMSLTLPEDTDMSLSQQMGVQFKTIGTGEFSVYIDAIDW